MTSRDQPMTERELDLLLGAWFDEGAPTAPDRIAENAMAQIATVPQERDWPGVLRASFSSAPLAWAAGFLALAIGLGVVLGPQFITDEPSPVPSPSAEPSASDAPAPSQDADATTHTSLTPVGTIDWSRVEAETRTLAWGEVDGLIVGYQVDENFEVTGWFTSEDGVSWSEASEFIAAYPGGTVEAGNDILSFESPDGYSVSMGPVSHRQVIYRDWLDSPGDWGVYRRADQSWEPVPVPAAEPTVPTGLRLNGSRFGPSAALSEVDWVAPLVSFIDIDWLTVLALDLEDAWPIWDEEAQRLELFRPGQNPFSGQEPMSSFAVSLTAGDPPTIEFRDDGGALVHAVPANLHGWTPDALLTALRGWGLDDVNFLVSRDGEITVVRPPWPMGEDWTESGVITALGRYYTATGPLGENFSLSGIRLWESPDGLSWSEVSPPSVAAPIDSVSLGGSDDQLLLTISAEAGDTIWVSTDGSTWTQADIDPATPTLGPADSMDFGWLLNAFDATAVSADGLVWEFIDLPLLGGEPSVTYLNGRFIYGPESGVGGVWHTWIGRLRD